LEIGTAENPANFFVQSIPINSPKKIVEIIKSITTRELFRCAWQSKAIMGRCALDRRLFVSPDGKHRTDEMIVKYVGGQSNQTKTTEFNLF
jgi:hypothetical protein